MKTAYDTALKMAHDCPDIDRRVLMMSCLNRHYSMQTRINNLHRLMDTPVAPRPVQLSPADRYRRIHYVLSEFIETTDAAGFNLFAEGPSNNQLNGPLNKTTLQPHIKAARPFANTIEVLDGLADIIVVVLGFAAEMGEDLMPVLDEVIAASVTKLQPDGFIRKNQCQEIFCPDYGGDCDNPDHFEIRDEPRGKWIKGPNYCPPQIAAIIGER